MKLLVSESEKERILGMHNKVRKMLFEATVNIGGIDVEVPNGVTISDNFKKACESWKDLNEFQAGIWTPTDGKPAYAFCKYKNNQDRFQEIKSDGGAFQHNGTDTTYYKGTWKLEGDWVNLSYMKQSDAFWSAMEYLEANPNCVKEINPTNLTYDFEYDSYNSWNDYYFSRVKDNQDNTVEIKSNGTWKWKEYSTDDTKMTGRWTWDGSKIKFDTKSGLSKRASGYFTEEDGPADGDGIRIAVFEKNKIGNIGAKGPVVKRIQWHVTPDDTDNPVDVGTGLGCGGNTDNCNGVYDQKTKDLVKAWQKERGLTVDGIFGKQSATWMTNHGSEKEDLNN